MSLLKESIKNYGILSPLIVRPVLDGVYEIVSGHRRKYAAQQLGYYKLPVIIRVMNDDEAIISMVDSNLQRERIRYSEKAFAYKMKNEAMKRKGGRKKSQFDHKLKGKKTIELIGEEYGDSPKQVQRFIKITELIPELLQQLDDEMIGFNPAVEMEYMNDRISTYYLFPFKKKCTSLLKRIVISQVYLIALIAVFYWGFVLMYHPTNYSGVSIAVLYIQCVCACAASMFFMGILCFTATNLLRNIGIGIGCVFLLWLFLTSSITRILPQLLQLFKLSGEVVQDGFLTPYWPSRILYAVVAIGLLFLNLYLVNKQPDYNKKGWCKHGNKGK